MRHIKAFNESKIEFFLKSKIDWKFVKNIEDVLTEYIDNGKHIEMSMNSGGEIFYNFTEEHGGEFERDDNIDFNNLDEWVTMMILAVEGTQHTRDECLQMITEITDKIKSRYGYISMEGKNGQVTNTEVCNFEIPLK